MLEAAYIIPFTRTVGSDRVRSRSILTTTISVILAKYNHPNSTHHKRFNRTRSMDGFSISRAFPQQPTLII
jgi:hypothetical protein